MRQSWWTKLSFIYCFFTSRVQENTLVSSPKGLVDCHIYMTFIQFASTESSILGCVTSTQTHSWWTCKAKFKFSISPWTLAKVKSITTVDAIL